MKKKLLGLLMQCMVRCYALRSGRLRPCILSIVHRLDGGPMYSPTLRLIFQRYYGVKIGLYSHGGCFSIGAFSPGVTVGRYCSIARHVLAFTRDHPVGFKSTHALFFNAKLGLCERDLVERGTLHIGNDVWIGAFSVILPGVHHIGDGAVIAAGSVLNRDVPPYAVVAGNPARVVRFRFSEETIQSLLQSRWWDKPLDELKSDIADFQRPYEAMPPAAVAEAAGHAAGTMSCPGGMENASLPPGYIPPAPADGPR